LHDALLGHCKKTDDNGLDFRGLVATPNGHRVLETTRSGAFAVGEAVQIGDDAGQQLKKEAGPGFFQNI